MDAATPPDPCPNCAAPLAAPRPRFCPQCGQETLVRAPTLGEFVQQFGGAYLSTEGALWRTLKLLLARPGELTAQYLRGRRKHYVLPLRLYLTISVVVLLVIRALSVVQMDAPGATPAVVFDGTEKPSLELDAFGGRAGLKDGRFYCEGLPAWVCARLQRRLDHDPKALIHQGRELGERFMANLGAAMFLLLPAFALALMLVYRNRRLRYTEHLVFALHVHAFWFLMLGMTLLPWSWTESAAALAVPAYTLLAMRRVYGGRWGPRLLRAAVVCVLYGLTMLVAFVLLGLWVALA